ncbi:hypothetical protein G6011_00825 [Alternaria panax]|uniref:non-specific serine/threonine protein kinase n=1 Tax=Alternaria panax TaxID=48097 RepID=A0AAD4IJL6_9PLEO|nr:hypothetical protein G6011_00825 [Alternaria panax]
MISNTRITEMRNIHRDSVVNPVDEIIAELRDSISHLTLFDLNDVKPVPKTISESPDRPCSLGYTSKFEIFCEEVGIDEPYPDDLITFRQFLDQKELESRSEDPEDYPGIQNAATLLLRDREAKDGDNFGRLDEELQEMLMNILNCGFSAELAHDRFVPGRLIGHGKLEVEWLITYQLVDISGSFNRGVFFVSRATDQECIEMYGAGNADKKLVRIMKTLPSPAHYPDFASREIWILHTLQHDNIIGFFDARVPEDRHETGWMVTEYCNMGTLEDLVEDYAEAKTPIPELFVWDILQSLARAVVYLHYGPHLLDEFDQQKPGSEPLKPRDDPSWIPVYHRDIILANVFCTSDAGDASIYPIVKLGDFGCAMRQSEIDGKDNRRYPWSKETPIMDPEYEPPEGQYATKAVDVYQIGLLMWCIVQNITSPFSLDVEAMEPENFATSSFSHYSSELRNLINQCIDEDPDDRLDSLRFLHLIVYYKNLLCFEARLPWVELLA